MTDEDQSALLRALAAISRASVEITVALRADHVNTPNADDVRRYKVNNAGFLLEDARTLLKTVRLA
jgi:hypothetical protein